MAGRAVGRAPDRGDLDCLVIGEGEGVMEYGNDNNDLLDDWRMIRRTLALRLLTEAEADDYRRQLKAIEREADRRGVVLPF